MKPSLSRLTAIFDAVLREAENNHAFSAELERALGVGAHDLTQTAPCDPERPFDGTRKRSNRRAKAVLDPFSLLSVGESHLRSELAKLNLDQLRDIVAEYGMDTSRLALKWKSTERLVDFLVSTVVARNRKGDVFRETITPAQDPNLDPGNVTIKEKP
jgi:hypothetical protein